MAIKELSVKNYRSVRDLRFRLKSTNVLTGPNGCGKSNLYNSLLLLSKTAAGGLGQVIAEEGGMNSVLWAGGGRKAGEPVRLTIAATTDRFSYEMSCGLPTPSASAFHLDPSIKEEFVWIGTTRRRGTTLFERSKSGAWIRDRDGKQVTYSGELLRTESVLSQLREPHLYPELSTLREEIANWRFYHHFRTDPHSPLRQTHIGIFTPALAHDGSDLAAALQTINEVGDSKAMHEAVSSAFAGAMLVIGSFNSRFELFLEMPNLLRPLGARELSDGTLRYLCLVAALLSPFPPPLLALNEPETSLHPDLLKPLAKLIAQAATRSQIWVTTHSRALAEYVEEYSGLPRVELHLVKGATQIVGQGLILPELE